MVVSAIFDPEARRRSYSILAEVAGLRLEEGSGLQT
jgi:hypothetical protein